MDGWTRRGFLGLSVLAAVAGCGASTRGSLPAASPNPSPSPSPLPDPIRWTARPGEVNPTVKARAIELLQAVGTWAPGAGGSAAAADRLRAAGFQPSLLAQLDFLTTTGSAAVTNVVDAQYGGILTDSASVLIPVQQTYRGPDGTVARHGSTFDVRLSRTEGRWDVTDVRPARPGPAVDDLTDAARAVLANPRIHLPDSARADVAAGQIHDSVLSALHTLSDEHILDVSVLRSGHPLLVFGTDRPSDHPAGRAADVWAIDGLAVVDPANRDLVEAFMRRAATVGPWQVGGPVDLDGAGSQYFSDNTHHDHVHMGFHT